MARGVRKVKKIIIQVVAVAIIASLLAVYVPMNSSDADSGDTGTN